MPILNKYYYFHKLRRLILNNSFRGRKYFKKILGFIAPEMRDGIIVKTRLKFKLKIYPVFDKGIERRIFYDGIYEEGTLWCFKKIIKPGDCVFDIGANIGLTSVYASLLTGKKGKVYSFEPVPQTFQLLTENVHLNRLRNVTLVNCALSNVNGNGLIYNNLHINRGAASLYAPPETKDVGIKIALQTLDNFVNVNEINKIDFIKIDIEGSEVSMLRGAINTLNSLQKPIICIEFSRDVKSDFDSELLYKILKSDLSYSVFKSVKGKEKVSTLVEIRNENDLPQHDNLYCFQEYHLIDMPHNLFQKK